MDLDADTPTGRNFLAVFLAGAAALLLLSPLLEMGFTGDDYHLLEILERRIDPGQGFSAHNLAACFRFFGEPVSDRFTLWRPLVVASLGLDRLAYGLDEGAFQRTNLLLHFACGIILSFLGMKLVPKAPLAARGGALLLFLISPMVIETVSWSSARSETLSFLGGGAAILLKLDDRRRRALPALLLLLALAAKESALVFVPIVAALDLAAGDASSLAERIRRGRIGLLAVALVLAVWLTARLVVYGSLIGHYGHVEAGTGFQLGGWLRRVGQALAVFAAPVGDLAVESSPLRILLRTIMALATAVGIAGALRRRSPAPMAARLVGLLLLLAPLALSVLVNPLTWKMVGTRAGYTPCAGLALLLLAAASRPAVGTSPRSPLPRALLPLAVLLLASLILTRPTIRPHVETWRKMKDTIESIQRAARGVSDPAVEVLALIGYREARYFDDSYDMATPVRAALRPPFTTRPFELAKIGCPEIGGGPIGEDFRAFDRCLLEDGPRLAILAVRKDELKREPDRPLYDLVHAGRLIPDAGGRLEAQEPEIDGRLAIHLDDPDPLRNSARFTFRIDGLTAAAILFRLFSCDTPSGEIRVAPESLPTATDSDSRIIAIPPEVLRQFGTVHGKPMAWTLEAFDAAGVSLARTAPRFFRVDLDP